MAKNLSFFDPDKARGASDAPDVGKDVTGEILSGDAQRGPISVSALLGRIKGALTDAFPQRLAVVGELSNVKRHTSGHLYFRLKDAAASIDAVMFRPHAGRLKFEPTDGLEVVVEGRIDVYEVRGQLQLYAERMTPKGAGALELAFRQLQAKLAAEGLFDAAHKKPLAEFPRAIGAVTSATGAAIRDIRRTLARRWPAARVYLVNVLVQGEGAAGQIADAIRLLDANAEHYQIDTLIVSRGGGSLEDLWAFNEEAVGRAICAARTPVITGVGHEADVTIADLAADVRAPTPTGAAELAVPDAEDVRRRVAQLSARLLRTIGDGLERAKASLDAIGRSGVFRDPASRLRTQTQRLDELTHRLRAGAGELLAGERRRLQPAANRLAALHPARLAERAKAALASLTGRLAWVLGGQSKRAGDALAAAEARLQAVHPRYRLKLARQQVIAMGRQLEAMSYRNVLGRGFSVTRRVGGGILRSVANVRLRERIETELADGKFASVVDGDGERQSLNKPPPAKKAKGRPERRRRDDPQQTLFD